MHASVSVYKSATYVHEGSVDVVGALSVDGDEEGQAAVGRQHVHAAVLLVVTWQQSNAAVLHTQCGRHHVQRLHTPTSHISTPTKTTLCGLTHHQDPEDPGGHLQYCPCSRIPGVFAGYLRARLHWLA